MKRVAILLLCLLLLVPALSFAQNNQDQEENLQEFVIETFEVDAQWKVDVSYDVGFPTIRLLEGSPSEKNSDKKNQEDETNFDDDKVLGVKIDFIKRAFDQIIIKADNPIQIRGVVKTVSFFSIGRLYNHELSLLFKSYRGQDIILPVGKMNHFGWKKLEVNVPDSIDQIDPHYPYKGGLEFVGFLIDLDAMDIRGDYYVYFDDLRVITDIGNETYAKSDDIEDIW